MMRLFDESLQHPAESRRGGKGFAEGNGDAFFRARAQMQQAAGFPSLRECRPR